ncbi:MAG: ABC transporter substrate-binding protein [Burkholderiales bacterium]
MDRRRFVAGVGGALAFPGALRAQALRQFRVGLLAGADEKSATPNKEQFVLGLRDLGYEIGRNLDFDIRYAGGDTGRYAALADELIALKPDVLVSVDSGAIVMRAKTETIPIVLLTSTDPVADGLVRSLARPGTNVTGLADLFEQLVAKHVDLLTEIAPRISHIAFLDFARPPNPLSAERYEAFAKKAAAGKKLKLMIARARDPDSVRQVFATIERDHVQGIVVAGRVETYQLRKEIIGHARRMRLPAISALPPGWSEDGGLLNYGPDFHHSYRYAAKFVDRILKGARPADLPVEQISKYLLVLNLKSAREIGLTIPQTLLLRADRVIE